MKKNYQYEQAANFYKNSFNHQGNFLMGIQIASLTGKELNEVKIFMAENNLRTQYVRKFQLKALIKSNEDNLQSIFTNAMLIIEGNSPYKEIPLFVNYCKEREIEKKCLIVVIYIAIEEGYRKYDLMKFLSHNAENKTETVEEGLINLTKKLQGIIIKTNIKLIGTLKKCQHLIK